MLRLYIVDDEIMAIDYMKMLLAECGVEYELKGACENSLIACQEIIQICPDIVFVDINMPGMTGIELAKNVLEKCPDIKIVFLTAYRDFDFIKQGMDMGIDSYLLKNELNIQTLATELNKLKERLWQKRAVKLFLKSGLSLSGLENGSVQQDENFYAAEKKDGVSEKINYALRLVNDCYADSNFSLQDIADELNISVGHLRRIFKEEMNVSLSDFLNNYRIEKAKEFLNQKNVKITEIYKKVGFGTSQYFCTAFRKRTGLTPKEYRKKYF